MLDVAPTGGPTPLDVGSGFRRCSRPGDPGQDHHRRGDSLGTRPARAGSVGRAVTATVRDGPTSTGTIGSRPRLARGTAIARLEDLNKGAIVAGITPDALVTVVDVQWRGSTAVELTYKTAAGQVASKLLFRDDEPRARDRRGGPAWAFDGDGEAVPPRRRGEADRPRLPVRPVLAVTHRARRAAAAPDHRGLRGDAAAPAAALPAGRRPGRRQDDHGRALHPGAARPRRPPALPDRRAGQPRGAVAGRSSTRSSGSPFDILTARPDRGARLGQPVRSSTTC